MTNNYVTQYFNSLRSGVDEIRNSKTFDKIFILLWLIGPLIYLIERSPADIWLTSLGIIFLYRSYKMKDWKWSKQPWFIFALLLWITGLISAIQGPMPSFSFGQGLVWIRFPLYAVAVQIWLGQKEDIRVLMITIMSIALLIISFILFAEVLLEPKNRLEWPYGDVIPGSFIAKACLPVFCTLIIFSFHKNLKIMIVMLTILLLALTALKFTGERSNLILVVCALLTSIISYKFSLKKFFYISFFAILIGVFLINNFSSLTKRCTGDYSETCLDNKKRHVNIFDQIPIKNFNSSYWGAWRGGIQQGLEKPILGVGPSGTRHTCGYLKNHWLPGKNFCGNHPHNFYIQLFAEVGLIGLFFGSMMIFYIIKSCYVIRKYFPENYLVSSAFVVPFGIFFPFQHYGSFFGQWGNLFIWFAIGFVLSQTNIILNRERNKKTNG
jgi:O-antigen ligase